MSKASNKNSALISLLCILVAWLSLPFGLAVFKSFYGAAAVAGVIFTAGAILAIRNRRWGALFLNLVIGVPTVVIFIYGQTHFGISLSGM